MTAADQNSAGPLKSVLYVVVSILSLIGLYTITEPIFVWLETGTNPTTVRNEAKVVEDDPAGKEDPALEERIRTLRPVIPRINKAVPAKTYAVPTFPNTKIRTATPLQNDITTADPELEQRIKGLNPVVPRVNKAIPAKNYAVPRFPNATATTLPEIENDITTVDPELEERLRNLKPPPNDRAGQESDPRQTGQTQPKDNLPDPGVVTLPDPGRVTLPK